MIYFLRPIGAEGPVKIGHSRLPHERLKPYLAWSPVPLEVVATMPGGRQIEGRFHAAFMADHLHHEWFAASDRLSQTISAIRSGAFDVDLLPPFSAIRCGWRPSRESIDAGRMHRRVARLGKRGIEIPAHVSNALHTYGCTPEVVAQRRAIVRDFVLSMNAA